MSSLISACCRSLAERIDDCVEVGISSQDRLRLIHAFWPRKFCVLVRTSGKRAWYESGNFGHFLIKNNRAPEESLPAWFKAFLIKSTVIRSWTDFGLVSQ